MIKHVARDFELILYTQMTSAAGERSADVVIGICRHCRLRWLPGCCRAGPETAAVSIQPSFLSFGKAVYTAAKRVGLCFEAAFDFGLRRKGLCETFGLWNCVLR
ncbi:hypothetical protein Ahy_B02g057718 isoform C [Arachis hypogaea]|uniref:Uncharacterized protein n=1 Tax=Arachis hypogaea TaxID=3818 RepID=A0A445ACZ0_ARAHY|nr:hypothetical protein Ahy_B02g057718 isoform C [Arachis hypogaea]